MGPRASGDRELCQACVETDVCGLKAHCAWKVANTAALWRSDSCVVGSLPLVALRPAVAAGPGAPLFGAPFVVSFRLQMVDDDLVCRLALKH